MWISYSFDKHEFRAGDEMLLSDQSRFIEQAKCAYSHLGKASQKQIKTIEDQGIKQVAVLKSF